MRKKKIFTSNPWHKFYWVRDDTFCELNAFNTLLKFFTATSKIHQRRGDREQRKTTVAESR